MINAIRRGDAKALAQLADGLEKLVETAANW